MATTAPRDRIDLPGVQAADSAPRCDHRPLGGYAVLSGIFGMALTGALAAGQMTAPQLPERLSPGGIVLAGVATHKMRRLLAGMWAIHALADAGSLAYGAAGQRMS